MDAHPSYDAAGGPKEAENGSYLLDRETFRLKTSGQTLTWEDLSAFLRRFPVLLPRSVTSQGREWLHGEYLPDGAESALPAPLEEDASPNAKSSPFADSLDEAEEALLYEGLVYEDGGDGDGLLLYQDHYVSASGLELTQEEVQEAVELYDRFRLQVYIRKYLKELNCDPARLSQEAMERLTGQLFPAFVQHIRSDLLLSAAAMDDARRSFWEYRDERFME